VISSKTLIAYILIVSCLLAGCSETEDSAQRPDSRNETFWPIFRGDNNLSGVADARITGDLSLLWSFQTGAPIVSSAVIAYGSAYSASTDGIIFAIDLEDGTEKWRFDTKDDIEASPIILDSTLYIGTLSGTFLALDAVTGLLQWQQEIDADIMGSANWVSLDEGERTIVMVGSYDNVMYAFNAANGDSVWSYQTDYYINGAPATDGHAVVFGGCDEMLHIVSVSDGAKIGEVHAGSYIAGSAALVDNRAYLGHYGGKMVCIDIEAQELVWEYEDEESGAEFFSSPAVGDTHIYIGSRDNYLHCVDRESGEFVWKFQTRDEIDSSPVLAGDKLVFASTDGRLYLLDSADGTELWSYEIGAPILGSPAVIDGMIVIGAEDGSIYAFGENR